MKTIILETSPGDTLTRVAEKAKVLAVNQNCNVTFDFNGRTCIINPLTDLGLFNRDWKNAWTMDWKTIGPDCVTEYPTYIQKELEARTKAREEKNKASKLVWEIQDKENRRLFNESVKDIEFKVVDIAEYNEWKSKNTDGYGNACFEFAESWAKLMQKEINRGALLNNIAGETSRKADFLGITGFQYGMAVNILSKCWVHGEDLRKWHNKEYNHEGDGVVNPAILTIGNNKN